MKRIINPIQDFFKLEAAGGIVLSIAVVLALLIVNSPLHGLYESLIHSKFDFNLLYLSIVGKDFHYFVNDGLMAIFFLLIGLEVKREFVNGELSNPKNIILPALAAVGGLLIPMAIYHYFNGGTPTADGWAIPAATDIAIAIGVLSLLGDKVPQSLKTFLMMLAIFDDLLVIGIIGLFFTETIQMNFLAGAAVCCVILGVLNHKNVSNFAPFAIIGFILWYCILQSGIHATVAGILLAMFIPTKEREEYDSHNDVTLKQPSMLSSLEHSLHEFVSFGVLPIFAFVNAGVLLSMDAFMDLTSNLSLGIILGLFIGKQIGIFGVAFILIKTNTVSMPKGSNLGQLYGVSILCGIGFTMGLFIGDLAFAGADVMFKLPILVASFASAIIGYAVLAFFADNKQDNLAEK